MQMAPTVSNILLVEDDEDHAELVRISFRERPKFCLQVASTLAHAKELVESSCPHLVITDLNLPDGQGTLLLEQERFHEKCPVVVLTSHGNEAIAVDAMKSGALDYVVKTPETLATLPRVAERALREWGHILTRIKAEEALRDRETELAHVNRLSTMGEMLAGIAHELNQPLYAIGNFANACRNFMNPGPNADFDKARELCGRMGKEAEKAGEILRRLRDFSRPAPRDLRNTCVNEVVRESIELLAVDAKRSSIQIALNLAPKLPHVHSDPIQIQQVLVNLLRNAYEAMQNVEPDARHVCIDTTSEGDMVEISVTDRGIGLPDAQDSIFHPFVTTKEQGMGMGLAICRNIVDVHGGRLWATPNSDNGCTFHFTLPVIMSN